MLGLEVAHRRVGRRTSWPLPRGVNFFAARISAGIPRSDINLSSPHPHDTVPRQPRALLPRQARTHRSASTFGTAFLFFAPRSTRAGSPAGSPVPSSARGSSDVARWRKSGTRSGGGRSGRSKSSRSEKVGEGGRAGAGRRRGGVGAREEAVGERKRGSAASAWERRRGEWRGEWDGKWGARGGGECRLKRSVRSVMVLWNRFQHASRFNW